MCSHTFTPGLQQQASLGASLQFETASPSTRPIFTAWRYERSFGVDITQLDCSSQRKLCTFVRHRPERWRGWWDELRGHVPVVACASGCRTLRRDRFMSRCRHKVYALGTHCMRAFVCDALSLIVAHVISQGSGGSVKMRWCERWMCECGYLGWTYET